MSTDTSTSPRTPAAASDSWNVPASLWDGNEPADRGEREQSALLALARRVSTLPALDVLLQNAGAMVAEVLKADVYGVGEVFDGGAEMEFTLTETGPDGAGAKRLSRRGPLDPSASIAAYAIQAALPIVASNVAQDPRFTDLFVRQSKVVSALAIPLSLGGKPMGVLAVFSKEAREFVREDVRFAEMVGHLLTASIARAKSEEETFRFRMFAQGALEMIDSLVLKLDPRGNILDMNAACRRATGFEPAEVRNQPLPNVLAVAREVDTIQEKLRQVKRATTIPRTVPAGPDAVLRFESQLLTKAGEQRPVAWSLKALRDQAGTILYLLMTGADRSESAQAASPSGQRRRRAKDVVAPATEDDAPSDPRETPDGDRTGPRRQDAEPPSASPAVSVASPRSYRRTPTSIAKDLRSSPRRAFRCSQRIAPILGGQLPGPGDFFEVECEDISAGGIAFHLNRPPDFETLVIALGKPPQQSHVSARVVRCTKDKREGAGGYLVGCSFTGKVSL
jgi:PAS domain S-box-containing protein